MRKGQAGTVQSGPRDFPRVTSVRTKPRVVISYSMLRLAESCSWLNRIKVTAPRS
jgi:hypothetical protein